ncbi:MAG: hypothetical protein U0X71_00680 [Sphingobacteriaceae bacterium]
MKKIWVLSITLLFVMLMGYLRCKKDSPASSGGGDTGGGSLTGTGGGSLTGTNGGGTVFCSSCASTHTINVSPGDIVSHCKWIRMNITAGLIITMVQVGITTIPNVRR